MKKYNTEIDAHYISQFTYFISHIGMSDAVVTKREVPCFGGYTYRVSFEIEDEREYDLVTFKLRRGYTVEDAFNLWMRGRILIEGVDKEVSC